MSKFDVGDLATGDAPGFVFLHAGSNDINNGKQPYISSREVYVILASKALNVDNRITGDYVIVLSREGVFRSKAALLRKL